MLHIVAGKIVVYEGLDSINVIYWHEIMRANVLNKVNFWQLPMPWISL